MKLVRWIQRLLARLFGRKKPRDGDVPDDRYPLF